VNLDSEIENKVVLKVELLINDRDFGQICFEVGRFIETVSSALYFDLKGARSKNAKAALDFLIDQQLISRPLGYKLHSVREMRNVEVHGLPYPITQSDARLAVDTLNQTIEWLHQGNLAREWTEICELFNWNETCDVLNLRVGHTEEVNADVLILKTHRALEKAVDLRMRSLGLDKKAKGFFSSVELLAEHGIDVKSTAWRELVSLRNRIVHDGPHYLPPNERLLQLKKLIPELREVLMKLNPLEARNKDAGDYPQVHSPL
jgi:uncharacterized protein YutE (UPF0331/DUF86 family)